MLKVLKRRLVLFVSLVVVCVAAGCAHREEEVPPRILSRWLVSPELLQAGKLEIVWDDELPLKQGESLRDLRILGDRIYGLSDRNFLVSLDREKGTFIFGVPVARPGFAVLGLELYKNEVMTIIGDKLIEINPDSGAEHGVKRLVFGAVCPPARNDWYYYFGGADRRMHTLRADDKVQVFEVAAHNDSMMTSIIADEDFVVFATDAGNVISIRPDRPKRLWQFNAAGSIVGRIVRDGGSLFFASRDTNVYKISIFTGKLVWKYPAGAVLDKAPRVTRQVVYQRLGGEGLAAIDKRSGKSMWQLDEGVDLLAEADGKAYVITNVGTLVVMDNKTAKRLYSVNFAGVSKYAANVVDSKIYIGDKAGRIACLKPLE